LDAFAALGKALGDQGLGAGIRGRGRPVGGLFFASIDALFPPLLCGGVMFDCAGRGPVHRVRRGCFRL